MIACQYYTVGFANSYPTGGFQGLGSFINKKCTEVTPVQYTVIAADKGGSYDMGIVKKIGIDLGLRNMMKLESKTIEIRWAQDVKQADGSTKTEGCKAFLRCVSKGIPGLSVDPGNTSENEATFAVSRYQLYVGGAEYWLIDQLNTILRVGGVDYAKDIRSLL